MRRGILSTFQENNPSRTSKLNWLSYLNLRCKLHSMNRCKSYGAGPLRNYLEISFILKIVRKKWVSSSVNLMLWERLLQRLREHIILPSYSKHCCLVKMYKELEVPTTQKCPDTKILWLRSSHVLFRLWLPVQPTQRVPYHLPTQTTIFMGLNTKENKCPF